MANPWNRTNVSPSDWLEILEIELTEQKRKASLRELQAWLRTHHFHTEVTVISRLKSEHRCEKALSDTQERLIQTIIENVSARSCILYFENLGFRAFKFFNPYGNPDRRADPVNLPLGLYQATRFSFSDPGKLIRSAFLFYKNSYQDEPLSGYADNLVVNQRHTISNILRFKEIRLIGYADNPKYQILVGGFVFVNHGCFYLTGASFETDPNVHEPSMQAREIRHVQMVNYILDDDSDADVIRGLKTTGLRHQSNPAAAVIELERINGTQMSLSEWYQVRESGLIELGVFDLAEGINDNTTHLQKYVDRLKPMAHPEYKMTYVDRK